MSSSNPTHIEIAQQTISKFISHASQLINDCVEWTGRIVTKGTSKLPSFSAAVAFACEFFSWLKAQAILYGPIPFLAATAWIFALGMIASKAAEGQTPGFCQTTWKVIGVTACISGTLALGFASAVFLA